MRRLLAALLGVMVLLLPTFAAAEDVNPFLFDGDDLWEDFGSDVDPFSSFADAYETDPFLSFLGDGESDDELFAFAFGGDGTSSDDKADGGDSQLPDSGATEPPAVSGSGSMQVNINGEQLVLSLDPSPAYTNVNNNMTQAAFYSYGDSTGSLYELFLVFPYASVTGDTITPEKAMKGATDTSVMLLISGANSDQYYIASQLGSDVFPRTSSYSIHFDRVTAGEKSMEYEGTMSARLVSYNIASGDIGDSVEIQGAKFSFSISSASGDRQPDGDGGSGDVNPFIDAPTPLPTSTPSADYRKV